MFFGHFDKPICCLTDIAAENANLVGTGVPDCPLQIRDYCKFYCCEFYFVYRNFVYANLYVSGQSRTPVPTSNNNSIVSRFVATFKRFCNKEYGGNIWQERFYDHIIRNRDDYERHIIYINENPMRWYLDELYPQE